jgi:uncharacterized delta-60 repeat protein
VERIEPRLLFAAGDLDASFGAGGIATAPEVNAGGASSAVVDVQATSNRVYLGNARFTGPGDGTLLLSAFTPSGRLDNAWAGDGTVDTGIPTLGVGDLAVQSDGKVVALTGGGGAAAPSTLARFNTNGTFDTTFGGGDGRVSVPQSRHMSLAPGGKIVVAGSSAGNFAVYRFNANGTPDTTFGGDGQVVVSSGIPDHFLHGPADMTVLPDGDVVVVGFVDSPSDDPGWDGFVARLNPDGSLDTAFDGDGRLIRDSGNTDDEITAVTAAAGGKFFIAPSEGEFRARPVLLNPDGTEDTSFQAPDFRSEEARIRDMHVTSDGKLIATGDHDLSRDDGPSTFMHRYNADGGIDGTFGGFRFHRPIGAQSDLAPDGKLVVGGGSFESARVARHVTTGGTTTTLIQAEHGRIEGARVRSNHAGFTGSGFVDFVNNTGDSAAWTVAAQSTGTHTLTFRYANGSTSPRVMRLTVDWPSGGFIQRDVSFNPTGSWTNWRTMTVQVPMRGLGDEVGLNEVRLSTTGNNGPNVDSLTVRRPTPRRPATGPVQAEDGTLGGAAFVSTFNSGYTGRGYVDFVRNTGDSLEWVLNADAVRQGRMFIWYANGSGSPRSLRVRVNGQVVNPAVSFAPTASWSNWNVVEVAVPLLLGDNTIRLESNGSSSPNVDRIEMA